MDENNNIEQKLKNSNKKLSLNDILDNIITDAYKYGYDDGYATIYNDEYVGDKSQLLEIRGKNNIIQTLIKKYKTEILNK